MLNVQGYPSAAPALAQSATYSQLNPAGMSVRAESMCVPNRGFDPFHSGTMGSIGALFRTVLTELFDFMSQLLAKFVGGGDQNRILDENLGVAGTSAVTDGGEKLSGSWLEDGKKIFDGVRDIWGMFSGGEGGGGSFWGSAAKVIGSFF